MGEKGAGDLAARRGLAVALGLLLALFLLVSQVGVAWAGGSTPVVQPTIAPTNTPGPDGHSACIPGNNGTPIPCPQPCSDNGTTFYPPLPSATPTAPPIPTYTPVPRIPPYYTIVVAYPSGTAVIWIAEPPNTSVPLPPPTAIPPDTPTPTAYPGCRWNNSPSGKDSNDGKGCDGWGVSLPIGPDFCFPGVDYYLRPVLTELGDDVANLSNSGVAILIGTPRLDSTLDVHAVANSSTISGVFATFYDLAGGLLGVMIVLAMVRAFLTSLGRDMMSQLGGIRRAIAGAMFYWLLKGALALWFPLVNLVAQSVVGAENPGQAMNNALISLVHTPNQVAWMQIAIFAFLVVLALIMLILVCSRIMGVFVLIALFVVSPLALVTWVSGEFKAISKWWFGTFVAYSLWGVGYAVTLDVLAVFIKAPDTLAYSACSSAGGGTGACLQPVAANFIGVIIICSGLIVLFRLPRVMDGLASSLGGSGGHGGATLLPMVTAAAGVVAITRMAPAISGMAGSLGSGGMGLAGAAKRGLSFGGGPVSGGSGPSGSSGSGSGGSGGGRLGGGPPGQRGPGSGGGSGAGGGPSGTGGSRGGPGVGDPVAPGARAAQGVPGRGMNEGAGAVATGATGIGGDAGAGALGEGLGLTGESAWTGGGLAGFSVADAVAEAAWAALLTDVSLGAVDPQEEEWGAVPADDEPAPATTATTVEAGVGEGVVDRAQIGRELVAEMEEKPRRRRPPRARAPRNTRVAGLFGDLLESQQVTGEASFDATKSNAGGSATGEAGSTGPAEAGEASPAPPGDTGADGEGSAAPGPTRDGGTARPGSAGLGEGDQGGTR